MANTHVKIASTTLTTSTNTVTFNSIPQTYTDLKIVYSGRGVGTSDGYTDIWFNNNSTSGSYGSRFLVWNATGTATQSANSYTFTYGYMADGTFSSNVFGSGYFYIPSYTNGSNLHNVLNYSNAGKNASSGSFGTLNGGYGPSGAITRLDLNNGSSSTRYWAAGSTITLYGI